MTPPTLSTEIPSQENSWQKYKGRVERLPQQDRFIKICADAGFRKTVEVGQYFMTKHTDEFLQFAEPGTCREYTSPRDEKSTDPKGWILGNTKIGPVLEVTTSYLHGKDGVEIRIMSMSKDNSHSWVRISHGSNKFVTNLNNNEQEISEVQLEEYALRLNAGDFPSRSKAKAQPRRGAPAGSFWRTTPVGERTWTDVEPGKQSLSDYPMSKKLIHLLRHGSPLRDNDGAIEFWRIKDDLQKHFLYCHHWSDLKVEEHHGKRRRKQENISVLFWIFRNNSVPPSSSRSFRTQSHWSYFTGQCHYSGRFLQVHLSLRMCNQFTFHHQFRIDTGRTNFEQQRDSIILTRSTWKHRVLHNTCTKHGRNIRIGCIGSTSTLLWRKDWNSFKHDRTLSFFTKHSRHIVFRKLFGWKPEKSKTRKYMRHLVLLQRLSWNMTGWKNWVQKSLDNQMEKLFNNPKVPNQANQIQTQIMIERGNPLFAVTHVTRKVPPKHVPLMEARTSTLKRNHHRTGKPVVCRDANHEQSMLNEVDIDFRIPGLPHSVVKQSENYSVRELVKKIENHPHRQSLQRYLQQNKAYNPFSTRSKKMIQDAGNVELFGIVRDGP